MISTASIIFLFLPLVISAPAFPPSAELLQGKVNENITLIAGGGTPNVSEAGLSGFTPAGITGLQLLATLENIEAFFYSDAIHNLTNGIFTTEPSIFDDVVDVISKIAAQEEVHVATVSGVLLESSAPVIPPCNYTFPSTTFEEFLAVANLLTSANLGSVIGAQEQLGTSNPSIGPSTTAILGAETRHDAFLRILHGLVPNPAPFDTAIPIAWAYNIGLSFIVPGSCPVEVALPTYPALKEDPTLPWAFANATYPETMSFSWDNQQVWVVRETGKQLYAAWLNQFNQPVYTPVTKLGAGSGIAAVPKGMNGVAYVALTTQQPATFDDLQTATLVGPLAVAVT
ncbi:hypothetical protein ONS95_008964 [Cadophora gregata]|uniref:uncharacterized protein n=1 Tax=Cadophora gregata TaxID=51156 RepID=UPI0026DDBC4D|nr:uncharacterized protein ONS95_008964 [Cadophora gregata]KAK0123976.1 hypothetical protein ONS95_008964 [Cadophora gregata]KAK0130315.1 hypothetical protein ONS96_000836 [Cadophora gregata f. sp. sojae]